MTRDRLAALVARVETATGPDREVDAEIACAIHGGEIVWKTANYTMDPYPARRFASAAHVGGFANEHVPAYTASLDAAMTLVPKRWRLESLGETPTRTGAWTVWMRHALDDPRFGAIVVHAPTPALALTAATLRALAEGEP